jgi:hypothetical protein
MQKELAIKKNDVKSASDTNSSQPHSETSGILKKFLEWISKGAEKTKICPT